MYPNGVGDGRSRYVAIFVHVMEGEHDDFLSWPYSGRITLSVLDRSGHRHNDINHTLQAKPTLAAFQRPREAICPTGYGFICFARTELFFGPQFVKNDELFLKIEFCTKWRNQSVWFHIHSVSKNFGEKSLYSLWRRLAFSVSQIISLSGS